MRSYEDRYHNLFFSYRGPAAGDRQLSAGNQLEDNVTRALVVTLQAVAPATLAGFVRAVAGLEIAPPSRRALHLQPPRRVTGTGPFVMLGLSPIAGVQPGSLRRNERGSRPDAAIVIDEGPTVIVESKVVGQCQGWQLWNHSQDWGLPVPPTPDDADLPDYWVLRSWSDVAAWARDAVDAEPEEPGRFLLTEFAEYLSLAGVDVSAPVALPVPRVGERIPVSVDVAAQPPLDLDRVARIERSADLKAVAAVCAELYGRDGEAFYVRGDHATPDDPRHTSHDAAQVRAAYEAAGESPPPGLFDRPRDVTTPRPTLSIFYGPDRFEQYICDPAHFSKARKFLEIGVDRAVLLGWLAWVEERGGIRPQYLRNVVAAAWPAAPVRSPAAPELHEHLALEPISVLSL